MAGPPRNRGAFFVQGCTYAAEDRMSGSGVVAGMHLCRDKIAGSDFGQRCRRWPAGRRAGARRNAGCPGAALSQGCTHAAADRKSRSGVVT